MLTESHILFRISLLSFCNKAIELDKDGTSCAAERPELYVSSSEPTCVSQSNDL